MKKILLLVLLNLSLFANIGTVMALKGSGVVQHKSGDEQAVAIGLKLIEGDTIQTQKKSRVQVMLLDETVVTIGSNSKFSFDEYSFNGKKSKVGMSASRGFFRSVTGTIGKIAPERFKVKTASATIGIRGTDFWGVTGGEIERVTCNKGAISIEFQGKTIEVEAGYYVSYGEKGISQGRVEDSSAGRSEDDADEGSDEKEDREKDEDKEPQKGEEEGAKSVPSQEKRESTAPNSREPIVRKSTPENSSPLVKPTVVAPTNIEAIVENPVDRIDIPTEEIADVTQAQELDKVIQEPFELSPGSEDREQQF